MSLTTSYMRFFALMTIATLFVFGIMSKATPLPGVPVDSMNIFDANVIRDLEFGANHSEAIPTRNTGPKEVHMMPRSFFSRVKSCYRCSFGTLIGKDNTPAYKPACDECSGGEALATEIATTRDLNDIDDTHVMRRSWFSHLKACSRWGEVWGHADEQKYKDACTKCHPPPSDDGS